MDARVVFEADDRLMEAFAQAGPTGTVVFERDGNMVTQANGVALPIPSCDDDLKPRRRTGAESVAFLRDLHARLPKVDIDGGKLVREIRDEGY